VIATAKLQAHELFQPKRQPVDIPCVRCRHEGGVEQREDRFWCDWCRFSWTADSASHSETAWSDWELLPAYFCQTCQKSGAVSCIIVGNQGDDLYRCASCRNLWRIQSDDHNRVSHPV
jgi:hypothetical protein